MLQLISGIHGAVKAKGVVSPAQGAVPEGFQKARSFKSHIGLQHIYIAAIFRQDLELILKTGRGQGAGKKLFALPLPACQLPVGQLTINDSRRIFI